MKLYTRLFLIVALLFGAPHGATAETAPKPQDDLYKSVLATLKAKKYAEAMAQAEKALALPDLLPQDKVRFLNAAANAAASLHQYERAQGFYERIVGAAAVGNSDKIAALKNSSDTYIDSLAGQYLDQMNLAPAHDALNRALQLPDLKPEERAAALKNIGHLCEREDNFAQALEAYQQITQLEVRAQTKAAALRSIADVYLNSGQAEKAIALYRENNFDLIPLYYRLGKIDEAVGLLEKVLDDPAASDADRWAAFCQLPYWGWPYNDFMLEPNDLAGARRAAEKYLPALMKTDANRSLVLLRGLFKKVQVLRNTYYHREDANPAFVAWAAPFILQAPILLGQDYVKSKYVGMLGLSDKEYGAVKTKYVHALAALGEHSRVATEAQSIATDPRIDATTEFWAKLVAAKADTAQKLIAQEKSLPEKEKAQAILDAAQTLLLADNNLAARRLYSAYEALFVQRPPVTIHCPFVPNAPFDVGSWLASPLLKDAPSSALLDRPYGDNLQFLLETDASSTGRNTASASKKSTGDSDTDFHIACDARGIHLFFDAHDVHAQEVLDGLLSGGSFELYLAPGKNQAYYTYIPELPGGRISTGTDSFKTMYPNAGFRLPSTEDGTLASSAHSTSDGFGLAIFLAWQLFYDKLPANGDKWQFEAIRWTRSGGFSFAGSESVHNRSSWGDIIFSGLTPQNLNAIKRAIVFSAATKYRDAKKLTSPVGQWSDPELGDPAFYQAKVAPLLEQLDKYQGMVNKEMTAEDVETIFREAVPGWMELNYNVATLRTQYLQKEFISR
jgi:tetratricopeptide (TPR) repeat protein